MRNFILFSFFCLLAGLTPVYSQTLNFSTLPNIQFTCGSTVSVPVSVNNFNNITAFQYSMEWDETILSFNSVGSFNLQHLNLADFGLTQTSSGILTVAWIDEDFSGETLANGTVIYTLNFTVIGAPGSVSPITFPALPTPPIAGIGFPPTPEVPTFSSSTVTIGDAIPPTITCPANTTVNTAGTNAVVNGIAPSASDNCGTPTVTYSTTGATTLSGSNNASGQSFNVGTTTVTYTATDGQSLTASCSFTVTVNQITGSLVITAGNDVANCADNTIAIPVSLSGVTTNLTAMSFTIMWDPTVISYSSVGSFNLDHLDVGDFGITQVASGKLTFSWIDDDLSGTNVPGGAVIFVINFTVSGSPGDDTDIMFVNSPTSIIAAQGFPPVVMSVVTQNGNAAIVDDPPAFNTCPANITLPNTPNLCTAVATWTLPTATDDCDGPLTPVLSGGLAPGSAFPVGTTTVTYTATDSKNQTTTCSFTVTVNDTQNPVPTCPANISASTAPGVCSATVTYTATVSDNCPGATVSPSIASGSSFPLGTTSVTYTATDGVGNTATCSFNVTVTDNQNPVINNCPSNITQANTTGQCAANVSWTAPTATDNCSVQSLNSSAAPGSSFPVGTSTVTYTATDGAGNTATCSFTVTVIDNQAPTLTGCPITITVNNAPGQCGANVTWTAPTATDNCAMASLTPSLANGSFFNVGTTNVTYIATDVNNNASSCTFSVTVVDMEDPEITCPANFSQNTAPGVCQAVVNLPVPVDLSDNCPGVTYASSPASGSTFPLGPTTVTYTATDGAGRTATCSFTVTINDNQNPVIANCPANITQNNTLGQCSANVTWTAPTATDNCGTPTLTSSTAPGSSFPVGTSTVTYTATDGSGNTATCSFTVTVTDVQPPSVTGCPVVVAVNSAPGQCGANATWTAPTATDNCGVASITPSLASGSFFNVGTTTVSYTVLDVNGNSNTSCSFSVIVTDVEDPEITCPANFSQNTDPGVCQAIINLPLPVDLSDNCPGVTYTSSPASGSAFPLGPTTVTYTATDGAGRTASCFFTVTVNDVQNPVLANCPSNITQNNAFGLCSANVTWVAPTATDNCGIPALTSSATPGSFPVGVTTVTYTAMDASGNMATCSFTVTVTDVQLPSVSGCPVVVSANSAPGQCGANASWTAPTAADNCGVASITPSIANGSFFNVGTTTVTYTVTDVNGNSNTSCSFSVIVVDVEDPEITCPANVSQNAAPGVCQAVVNLPLPVDLSDNCPGVTYTSSPASGSTFPLGPTTVTYTAIDGAGQTATCTFTVTIVDTQAPSITCPANITQGNDAGECGATIVLPNATATDLCSLPVTISNNGPVSNEFPVGSYVITYTATDGAGNTASCTMTVTVNDTENPSITGCPGNISATTDPGTCSAVISWTEPTGLDNCGGTLTSSHDSGDTFPLGTTTVTYTAQDGAGNTATCTFTVTVVDDEAPQLVCPANITVEIPSGMTAGVVNGIALVSVADNCTIGTTYWQLSGNTTGSGNGTNASGASFNLGVTTVTYFAEDNAGNEGGCSFTVTVEEEGMLEITCPVNQTANSIADLCGATFGNLDAIVTPPSGAVNLSYQLAGATMGSGSGNVPGSTLFNVGTTTVTYTTFNLSTIVTCSFTLTVIDNTAPSITGCPQSTITVANDVDACGAIVTWPAPTATDNCGVIAFTVTQGPGTFFPAETTPVEYVAVDAAGNLTKCSFNVVVNDTQNPSFSFCPGNLSVNTSTGACSAVVNWPLPVATDNCSFVLTSTHQPGATFGVGTVQIAYKATDPAGNMGTCTFDVTVMDAQPPFIFNLPSDIVAVAQPGECGAIVTWDIPGAQDNCGIESFGCNYSPGTFFNVTAPGNPVEVQCIALDIHGNVRIESFDITVLDNTPPVINCPANVIVSIDGTLVDDPSGFLTGIQPVDCEKVLLGYSMVTASDACGIASVTLAQGPVSGGAFSTGNTTMAFTAMDNNGNETTCNFTVNVLPTEVAVADAFPLLPCEGDDVFFFVNTYPGATYTWKDPNGNVVGNSDFIVVPAIEASEAGVYTVTVDLPFCSIQGSVAIDVAPVPNLSVTANDLLCTAGNMPLNLSATDLANSGVVDWVWQYPNGTFAFGQNQTVNNATPANAGTYYVAGITANGCVGTGEINIQIYSEPAMPSLFGTSSAICKGSAPVVLNGQAYSGNNVVYNWSATPATGSGLTPINNNIVSVSPTAAGQYTYQYFVTVDGCNSATATWVINVEEAPALSLSIDGQTACVSGSSSVTIFENGGQAINWQWSGPAGPIPGNVDSIILQNVNAASSGLYTVTATTALGCQNVASIPLNVTVKPAVPAQLIVSSNAICNGGTVTLSGTPYAGATYIWTGANLPPFPQNLSSVDVTLNQAGNFDYTFAALVNGCSTDTVSASVLVEATPALNITATGPQACVQGQSNILLNSNAPDAASWEWTNANGTVLTNAQTLTLTNVSSASSGSYTVTASSSIGCTSVGTITLNITDGLPPVAASLKNKACDEGTIEFDATYIDGATYTWRKAGGNVFSTLQSPTLLNASPAINGNYIVTASRSGCIASDTIEVKVLTAPDAVNEIVVGIVNVPQSFNVVVNDILAPDEPYTIKVLQQPQNGTVSVGSQGVLTFFPKAGFREKDKMFYEICYDACPHLCDIASVDLRVVFPDDTCVITTLITPNNDGVNDNFVVSCLETSENPLNKLIVFNQWGDKVYDAAPYKNDWKGTYEGRDLPDGTYFYIFQRDPDVAVQKGFVMIYR